MAQGAWRGPCAAATRSRERGRVRDTQSGMKHNTNTNRAKQYGSPRCTENSISLPSRFNHGTQNSGNQRNLRAEKVFFFYASVVLGYILRGAAYNIQKR
eukprot:3381412-Pleurochrysis_carterae.AAC.1